MGKVCTFLTSSNAANMASPVDHALSSKVIKSFWIFFFLILFLDLVSQHLKNNLCNWWTHFFFFTSKFSPALKTCIIY